MVMRKLKRPITKMLDKPMLEEIKMLEVELLELQITEKRSREMFVALEKVERTLENSKERSKLVELENIKTLLMITKKKFEYQMRLLELVFTLNDGTNIELITNLEHLLDVRISKNGEKKLRNYLSTRARREFIGLMNRAGSLYEYKNPDTLELIARNDKILQIYVMVEELIIDFDLQSSNASSEYSL